MGKLTSGQRKQLSSKQFALPAKKAYPIPDASHAANAKARAAQQVKRGNLTPSQKKKIDAAANRVLRKKKP